MPKKHSRMKLLNQYTSRTVPGFVNVLGTATNTATVSLWSQDNLALYTPTTRKGDYFRGEMLFNNNTGALWLTITNVAVLSNYTGADIVTNTIGKLFVPKTAETFSYDLDGNLTNDGRWSYTWDAENRITSFTRNTAAPVGSRVKLDCQYDAQSRRTQKIVSSWNGSTYVAQSTNKFVYDGWNLIAILDATNGLVQSFQWGIDASGSLQGAGGVGGLLSMTIHSGTNAGTYFYCYDGNHNVTTLVNATNGAIEAVYDYEPFLGILRATGRLAFLNPFVGSTKFCDWETGFLYYGYRYYDPETGRWPNRDPIGEQGGPNIYGFVYNDPVSFIDLWGLECQNIFNFGLGGSWNVAPGIFGAWDFDVNVDKCDRWSSPATIEGCGYCYRVHVKAGAEIGVGAKFYWKKSASILGFGFQAALSAEFSLAKVGANGETTIFICPNPLGTVVDHDSSVVRLVDLTVGPTASVSASGGLHAGKYVNINVVGDITAYANLHATLGIKVVSYGSHGNIQAVGSFTGNIGFKSKLYARGNVFGGYFDWNFWDFDWTLFDKPGWAEEEELGRLWSW